MNGILNEYITLKFLGKKSKSQLLKTGRGLVRVSVSSPATLDGLTASEARKMIDYTFMDFLIF